ncbi:MULTISPECIES: EAL domain-containing protein [unclassified Vibrio]|uniref:EAL domain-containing protein n=1 Tax=Vibrio sp. HB236076 TaxID=3232307 RepID=A0AB39HMC7_9VIBR|nr:EAL domain-containing protein [Vibrio sp. HB161653]MDP5253285.1 EAL domain-containing protein [Vibrio sp. HB161653]
MPQLNDKKLLNLIRYVPMLFMGLFALAVSGVVVQQNESKLEQRINNKRQSLIEQHKETIKLKVDQIVAHVRLDKQKTISILKQDIRQRVEEAYSIAEQLQRSYPQQSPQQLTQLIADALRAIRFNSGRGYYFMFDLQGNNLMHGLRPQLQGKNLIGAQDLRGNLILKEHLDLMTADAQGEAFYTWWYQKPQEPIGQEFQKIGFGKIYKPLSFFIGTGEYVSDVENDIKQTLLEWLHQYQFEHTYVFVINADNKLVFHPEKRYIGKDINTSVEKLLQNTMELDLFKGDFIEYQSKYLPDNVTKGDKISYVRKVIGWDWVIGSGFYLDQFEKEVEQEIQLITDNNRQELINILFLCALASGIVIMFSFWMGQVIGKRFERFQSKIERDYKELELTKNKVQHLAYYDELTGIFNRNGIDKTILNSISNCRNQQSLLAIMFVDLDDFKKVNDQYGHSYGDKLLEQVSERFQGIVSETGGKGAVFRFGGDEFIFCFSELESFYQASEKANAVRDCFKHVFEVNDRTLSVGCSIGVSMYPADGTDPESLIRRADIALYQSKQANKGQATFFDQSISDSVERKYLIEEELKSALKNHEIEVYYQPQIDGKTAKVSGVEALARWNNATLGFVSPYHFIPVAEETGLIAELGLHVFYQACKDILAISPNGPDALNVSVNISPKQLKIKTFPRVLLTIASDVGIDISRITLEITENVVLEDLSRACFALKQLKKLGFGISLDDFGTGYSSLSYLNQLPISEIKIDRCFVDQMLTQSQSTSLINAIIAIAKTGNMIVVAEGVENEEQYQLLNRYGCHLMQGYYFSQPIDIHALAEFVCPPNGKKVEV